MPTDDVDDDVLDEQADLPDDLDPDDLEDLEEDDEEIIDDEAIIDDDLEHDDIEDDDLEEDDEEEGSTGVEAKAGRDDEDEEDEDDDEDSDDVEASLDVILKERLVVVDDEDDDEDEEDVGDPDERGDSPLRVLPKQPGEFVCQSCFLVKHPSQLADQTRMFCRDCV